MNMSAIEFIPSRVKPAGIVAYCATRLTRITVLVHVVTIMGETRFTCDLQFAREGMYVKLTNISPQLLPGNVVDLATTIAIEELSK